MLFKATASLILCSTFTFTVFAENTTFIGNFVQGGVVVGKNITAKKIFLDDKEIALSNEGYFIFGFGRDHKIKSELKIIQKKNNNKLLYNLDIEKSNYKIERIDGLAPKMVKPGPEFYKKIKEERALIKKGMEKRYNTNDFPHTFIMPAIGRFSGVYGSQRILNGIKKNPHGGLDIAAPQGTEIKSIAGGLVLLAEKGLYYTGNIVIIGHGYGIKSMYIHMEDIDIKEGDIVMQGQKIGTIGMTGRATGPHLHLNIYINNVKVNPELLFAISK